MKKLNNSGFSLVELIIVMAIMAILTVAVAPQYLKYVERSRKSVDVQTMATVVSAIQIYAADPMADTLTNGNHTLSIKQGGDTTPAADTLFGKALNNAGISTITIKSKQWSSDENINFVVTVTDGIPTNFDVTNEKDDLDIIKGVTEKTTVSGS